MWCIVLYGRRRPRLAPAQLLESGNFPGLRAGSEGDGTYACLRLRGRCHLRPSPRQLFGFDHRGPLWRQRRIAELHRAGNVRPRIDSVWYFGGFEKAFEKLEGGNDYGRIFTRLL